MYMYQVDEESAPHSEEELLEGEEELMILDLRGLSHLDRYFCCYGTSTVAGVN